MISGIYQIKNLINKKCYIGSAINFQKRWWQHEWDLKNNKHHSQYLQNAYNKYGKDAFEFEILFTCPKSELIRIEQYFLNNYQPSYNICRIAGSVLGRKHSEETKRKISTSNIGKKHSEESKVLIGLSAKNRVVSDSTKQKISNLHKGRKHSQEAKNKMSSWQKGRTLSEEEKDKNLSNRYTPIVHICNITFEIINEFKSMKQASLFFNVSPSTIHSAVTGKTEKMSNGHIVKYKKDITNAYK